MHIINKLAIAAAVPALAVSVPAAAQAGGGQMVGTVTPVCEVNDLFGTIAFDSLTAGASISDSVNLRCNDADGATVTLISSEGGLESDDNEDLEIEYTATLTNSAIDGGSVTLDLPLGTQGDNDASASENASGSTAFATGVAGSLEVTLKETAVWAGGYSDTITVQLTAS
ncbi:MAG: hypothetical protein WA948_08410 [Pontixanthobacter sp.]